MEIVKQILLGKGRKELSSVCFLQTAVGAQHSNGPSPIPSTNTGLQVEPDFLGISIDPTFWT